MSALAQSQQNLTSQKSTESVTSISAVARVDYILRFSKQAVIVIDDDISACSNVGSQFLANLSNEQNAAFITMSAKLNDLQVRCRLIEQLFGDILFDPEQSVAVSLINLIKQHRQTVSIVVDNAQHLSLQLIHELAQLAEIAKKADYQISVLLLSTTDIGSKINQNQSIFHKKLSIISASTGQLISHDAKLLRSKSSLFHFTTIKKWSLFFILLSAIAATTIYLLYQQESFVFTKQIGNAAKPVADVTTAPQPSFVLEQDEEKQNTIDSKSSPYEETATPADIFSAITSETLAKTKVTKTLPQKAQPIDIMNAISTKTNEPIAALSVDLPEEVKKVEDVSLTLSAEEMTSAKALAVTNKRETLINTNNNENKIVAIDNQVSSVVIENYLGKVQGFVIQIAGFTQKQALAEFLAQYRQISMWQYMKQVNGTVMTIVTSEHFETKALAEQALGSLPQSIKDRSPWIKAISVINTEINDFQRSQSQLNSVTIPSS